MFFLFQEHNGNFRLLGSPWFPAEVAANDTTGTAVTDRKGVTFTITDNGFGPCPIYEGVIPATQLLIWGFNWLIRAGLPGDRWAFFNGHDKKRLGRTHQAT